MVRPRTKAGNPHLAVGVIRMSTRRQEMSPHAQAAAVERWAAAHGVTLLAYYFDLGVSGAAPVHERPGLVGALASLREHGAGVLVAANRSRIARDTGIMATVESAARSAGAVLRTADGASDGAEDDEGAFVRRSVEDMMSVLERMKIRARTRAGLAVRKARNERVGELPFGFRLAADGVHLERDDAEQAVLAAVTDLRATGASVRGIAAELAARGVVGRTGRALSHTQVHRLVQRNATAP